MKQVRKLLWLGIGFLAAFVLWTMAVCLLDVQPIGPEGSKVGMATLNGFVHRLTGVHFGLYHITDWLGLVPIFVCMGFAVLGLVQWVRRKQLGKVDFSIFVLGGFYAVTIAMFVLFEKLSINFRPVLINGVLEASYPSSTTLLVMCVMPTAVLQCNHRISIGWLRKLVCRGMAAFTGFMVIGRLLSGVHWVTDIIGGGLLSAGLVLVYAALCGVKD